jgi:hypothetical protein
MRKLVIANRQFAPHQGPRTPAPGTAPHLAPPFTIHYSPFTILTTPHPGAPKRDYIYLDIDRLRVLTSQLPDAPSADPASALTVLSGQHPDDRRLFQSPTETRALHTALFAALEQHLADTSALTDIAHTFDFTHWTPESFRDGQFIRTTGLVRLLDYPWLASVMETMPKMLKVTQRTELSALKQRREAHQITQKEVDDRVKEHQAQLKDLEGWRMDELTEVVRELFGQTVRLKIQPPNAQRGEMFVGSCLPAAFLESPAILSQKYGCDIDSAITGAAGDGGWKVVGLLNLGRPTGTPAMPTGNAVEDMFERLALAVNRIHRVASAPAFPALSLTPLAIYRDL